MFQPGSIALYTDFGSGDHYLGQLYSVICRHLGSFPVYELMNNAPRYNPKAASYLLAAILKDVCERTIVVSVVDPGVGSERNALFIETNNHILIGPDNGLLSMAVRFDPNARVSVIDWRPETLSNTFHGRDLFAPIAAMTINGDDFETHSVDKSEMIGSDWADDLYEIIHVDSYGNLITGIRAETISVDSLIDIEGNSVSQADTFSAVPVGSLLWYENSSGLIEIACNQGSAFDQINATVGSTVTIGC